MLELFRVQRHKNILLELSLFSNLIGSKTEIFTNLRRDWLTPERFTQRVHYV